MEKAQKIIVVHYHEIGLKGKNRGYFEEALRQNIVKSLDKAGVKYSRVARLSGRIVVYPDKDPEENEQKIAKELNYIFGIAYFSFGWQVSADLEKIEKALEEILIERLSAYGGKNSPARFDEPKTRRAKTFRISAKRSDKKFPLTSEEINQKVGECIIENFQFSIFNFQLKVNLKNPDINCFIEITQDGAFLYFEKIKALGGLPVGVSGKVLSLISSGFDSPVAAWHIMKRGARVDFVHFHSYPRTSKASVNNVKELVKILNNYQSRVLGILYLVPLLGIQREVFSKCEAKYRIILYRRFMFRIAERLAEKIGAGVLVTGESLGQVASQTLENIKAASAAISIPVFRPLIGTDKEEIINEAKKIGTYDISSQPYEDCCSLFTPAHPETRARISAVEAEEQKLDIEKLTEEAMEKTEKVEFKN
ncbi:tRNA 4-thiouridine(8) synthase ThiI [Patescibacteria group bacterium]|nr:tRNA 4-thiouridine(8) synthase ThiI [Patescibacteria group bacterium]MBU4000032.1 tRNA 4-thiouridine(8) synthase ThiI [Patescibacteria group bacterium]MBU4056619.1 tRNA 4-thiouridine(8) synthase ThiI [Patescibacteria group bacterium]MBU4368646.1 tRNA 4-thiouridine(8) synthase ThiI [Patescibacteria group bacterium]